MIFVFKTSVKTHGEVRKLQPLLDRTLPRASWTFDLEDSDKILRINSEEDIAPAIINLLNIHDFQCEELE